MIRKIYTLLVVTLMYSTSMLSMELSSLDAPKIGKTFTTIPPYGKVIQKNPPNIGVYGPEYPMLSRIARIQFSPEMINNWLPNALRNSLPAHSIPDLTFDLEIDRATPQTYNMVFHPWARTWQNQKFFNVAVPMGIFSANGVQPAPDSSIPFNKLAAQSVHIHAAEGDTLAYSPNNARFTVSPNRAVSSFWSAAVSPNGKHGIVTLHILANNDQSEQIIKDALHASNTLREFVNTLEKSTDTINQPLDRQTLQEAINLIGYIIGIKKGVVLTGFDLQKAIEELTLQLTNFKNQLK